MWYLLLFLIPIVALGYEYRLRRPDQLLLYESRGVIGFRTARWYPRHFSLALPGTTHMMEMKHEASAKGGIPVIIRIAAAVAASRQNIGTLVRVAGWSTSAVSKAAKELEPVILGLVKDYTENAGLEALSSEALKDFIAKRSSVSREEFGIDIVSLTVQSIDPVDSSLGEALRQRESARILEQTEEQSQNARVAAAQAKLNADQQIADMEHKLELKRLELRRAEQDQVAEIAHREVEEELKRNRLRLQYDREEMEILKDNPQLLLLTPQAARLAEASQSLKNARTVISLSQPDADQGAKMAGLFQMFLEGLNKNSNQG